MMHTCTDRTVRGVVAEAHFCSVQAWHSGPTYQQCADDSVVYTLGVQGKPSIAESLSDLTGDGADPDLTSYIGQPQHEPGLRLCRTCCSKQD